MKLVIFFLLILPSLIIADDVIDLSDKTSSEFKEELKNYDTALVEFFAPWCGHCKRLAPEYNKAATELKSNDPYIPLVKVDCTSDNGKDLCQENGVSGYPTLKIFRFGEFAQEYNGPRESFGIVKYMKSQVGDASKNFKSFDELKKKLSGEKDVLVLGIFDSENDDFVKKFHTTASKLRENVAFAHIYKNVASGSIKEITSFIGSSESGIILVRPNILKNKFEDSYVAYDKSESLEIFIKSNYHGLVGHRTQSNVEDFKTPLIVAYFDVDYVKNPKGTNYYRNRILKVAKEVKKENINFAISNNVLFSSELDGLEDKIEKNNLLVLARDKNNKKYILKEKFSVESLKNFVDNFLKGKLEPFIKSEEIPSDNSGPVKVAVGKNFDDLVINSKKDVFIEFYAPWCGHCKNLAPIYEELGKALQNEPNIDIIKMDVTANDITGPFTVHGFPTLYFYPSDTKEPKKYEGKRELKDFISYIAKHATHELQSYKRDGSAKPKDEL